MRPLRSLLLGALSILAASAWLPARGQEVQVSSSVNKRALRVGETLTFTLRVEGVGLVPQPALPPLDGFKASGQYQTVENTPGGKAFLFHYLLTPARPGRISVPPIQISVGGQTRSVPGFAVEVETALARPVAPEPAAGRPLRSDDFVLLGEVSTPNASVGQGVLYTLHLLAKPSVRRLAILSSPDFGGFQRVEDLSAENAQARQRRHGTGLYLDRVLRRYILFPLQAGTLTVEDFHVSVTVEVGEFPPRVQEIPLKGGAATVAVAAPPPAPPGFSGSVGSFTLTAEAPAGGPFAPGQPFSVVYRIRGEGFLPAEPVQWPETPLFQRYPPSVADESGFQGGTYRALRTVTVAFLPKVSGPATLPPARMVAFRPEEKAYEVLEAGGLDLFVSAPEGGEAAHEAALAPLFPNPRKSTPPVRPMPWGRFWVLLASPFLMSLLLVSGRAGWERIFADPEKVRRRRLRRTVAREMSRGRRSMDTRKHEQFHRHLDRALASHLELALGRPAEGLTRPQLRSALEDAGWDPESTRRVAQLLEELESARYAPGQPVLRDLQERYAAAEKVLAAARGGLP